MWTVRLLEVYLRTIGGTVFVGVAFAWWAAIALLAVCLVSRRIIRRALFAFMWAIIDANQMRTVPAVFAEHFVARLPGMPPLDRAAFQQFGQAFYAGFPDLRHHVEAQVAEGDTVTNRLLVRGTHRGAFQGIPPTGRAVEITAITMQRLRSLSSASTPSRSSTGKET